ncbi:hotdog family protein [Vibrio hannami]|uniref:hotdog family protein n=1 Tax=Vibrio hannami TaxID=2717094 RepID=UPI00240FC940|nr:hotdog family protein [Vibrio hannami]MDG3087541.1 hotdog family protein [Vibrio hannami]
MTDLPDVKDLLPHEASMAFIDRLIDVDETSVHCQVDVSESNLFFDKETNGIPAYVGIEFMAQTIAAWSGYHAWRVQNPPPVGFLLGSRRYNTDVSAFESGSLLDVYAEQVMEDNGMAVFTGRIEHDGKSVAQCQLNVYVPSEEKLEEMKKVGK